MGPNFCLNVGPLFSRNKNCCNEERSHFQENKSIGNKLSESNKRRKMKDSTISNSCGVAGNFILMNELRTQISTFRDLLDFSPCGGSLTIVQLLIWNLKDLSRTYPRIKQCLSLTELKHASVLQVYDSFCIALNSLGNHWANGDEWMEKSKNMSCNKFDLHGLEELVLATLKDINKLASERLFDMMDEDEQSMRDEDDSSSTSSFGNAAFSHSSSFNKSCTCGSPVTPTSVLFETARPSYDGTDVSLLSPRLLPLRVQAVGKLNPIDVKRLSFHMFPHVVTQEPSYPIHQTSKSDSESLNIHPQYDFIVKPVAKEEANQCSEILMDSEKVEDTRMFPQGNNCNEYLTNRTTLVSKNGNQENMDQVSSPALSLSPIKTQPPPPPPPPKASTTIKETSMLLMPKAPPPPPLPEGGKNSAPHPPPPPPPMIKGATPPPPPMGNGGLGAPPPPPPIGKGVPGAPPPMRKGGPGAPTLPPPMGKGGPGAPPPPPGLVGKNVLSNKAASKLKRSAQMGNLYRMVKGKVEGSNVNVKAQGKGKIGAPAGGKQGMADALAEITKKSAYFQQIEADVKNHAQAIKETKVAINGFQTSDMTELMKFHKHIESHLEKLTDESQVLARFEDFPTKKLEALRMSAGLYYKLDGIQETLKSWRIISPVNQVLDKIGSYFDKIKTEIDSLERTKDEEAKRFKAHKITFDFGILVRIKELMVDVSSGCMEQALKERREAKEKESIENDSKKKGSGKILWKAFQFAYRVYTFAGGHDDRADMLTRVLAQEIETDPHHQE